MTHCQVVLPKEGHVCGRTATHEERHNVNGKRVSFYVCDRHKNE